MKVITSILFSCIFSIQLFGQETYFKKATDLITKHEGFQSKLYEDSGHYSIGYGTNLLHGITEAEALLLLNHRLAVREQQLLKFGWFRKLSPNRKAVILDMTYNLGISGILRFKGMIWCIKNGYWNATANHMKKSLWYKQTGTRAKTLVKLMRKG